MKTYPREELFSDSIDKYKRISGEYTDTIERLLLMEKYSTVTCIAIDDIEGNKYSNRWGTEDTISVKKGTYIAVDITPSLQEYEIRDWNTLQLIDVVLRGNLPVYVRNYLTLDTYAD